MSATQAITNLKDSLKTIVPNWLANRLGLNTGFAVLYIIALTCDIGIQVMLEGYRAPLPGKGTPTALPYIGQTRGLIQGLTESDDNFISRLLVWLEIWENAGSAEILAQSLQTFLGNNLVVRVIDRNGNFVTANADGTTTFTTDTAWDWDSARPERAAWWGDLWVVIYLTDGRYPVYTSLTDSHWLAAWGTYDKFGTGMRVPRNVVDGVYSIIASFKGAHTWIEAIVWTTDTTSFVPGALSGIPDGKFGDWSFNFSGTESPSRMSDTGNGRTRYWIPVLGG